MRYCPLTYLTVFLKILIWRETLSKRKNGYFFDFFLEILKKLKLLNISFVALLILRHFI